MEAIWPTVGLGAFRFRILFCETYTVSYPSEVQPDGTQQTNWPTSATESPTQKTGKHGKPSKRRIEANRRNAQMSTGPRTKEGKERSRQNALKHGLTGAGIVIHPDDQEALRTRLEGWTEDLEPSDSVEGWLIGRAAMASVRLDRNTKTERAALLDRVDQARADYDRREQLTVEAMAVHIDMKPTETVRLLEPRALGCDWLLRQWAALWQVLLTHGYWTRQEQARALHLLGLPEIPTFQPDERLSMFWAAGLALLPTLKPEDVDAFRRSSSGSLDQHSRRKEARKFLPEPTIALEHLKTFVSAQMTRLDQRKSRLWEAIDAPLRKRAEDRALFDASDNGERMQRYDKSNSSEVHRCLNLFYKKRTAEAKTLANRQERRAEQADDRKQRREVAREVIALLKRRKARRAGLQSAANGEGPRVDSSPAPEPFVMPRPISERVTQAIGEPAGSTSTASENEATVANQQPLTSNVSSYSVDPQAPEADRAGEAPQAT
ncbi:MAG TPA: hypothetical protein VGZ22_10135 [Isosphaeraceae bacterium]|jgi:hypothetical protein|nr:hypothetical protein [Isosphaeraceae bacterium]